MNSTAMTRLTHAVMIVATLAAIVMVMPVRAAQPTAPAQVVTLPRVEVTGHRIVELPRVVVTGRRFDPAETRQARRSDTHPRDAQARPQTVVVAMR